MMSTKREGGGVIIFWLIMRMVADGNISYDFLAFNCYTASLRLVLCLVL